MLQAQKKGQAQAQEYKPFLPGTLWKTPSIQVISKVDQQQTIAQKDTKSTQTKDIYSTKTKHLIPIWIGVVLENALQGDQLKMKRKQYRRSKGEKALIQIFVAYSETFLQLLKKYSKEPYPGRHPSQWPFVIKFVTDFIFKKNFLHLISR